MCTHVQTFPTEFIHLVNAMWVEFVKIQSIKEYI